MSIRPFLAAALALSLAACTATDTAVEPEAGATQAQATATVVDTAPVAAPAAPAAPKGPEMDTFAMPANLQTTDSGLQYSIDRPGTGGRVFLSQTVSVHYTGWLTDGTKFDSSRDRGRPLEFPLGAGRVIKGWEEGVAAMQIGEKRTLVIPPHLGYGERGGGGGLIPPNATLVFQIELLGAR